MKAIIIALILACAAPGTRTEIGQVVNPETIETKGNLWCYDTEIAPGSFVVVEFDTLGTESIYDDVIIGITKVGQLCGN